MDLKIASIALVRNVLVLSANLRDFQQVPDLRVEDWRCTNQSPLVFAFQMKPKHWLAVALCILLAAICIPALCRRRPA
jgi:hypothetical protein